MSAEYDPDLVTVGAIQKMMAVMGYDAEIREEN